MTNEGKIIKFAMCGAMPKCIIIFFNFNIIK